MTNPDIPTSVGDASCREGWAIFTCSGERPYQIQAFDCPDEGEPELDSDIKAWEIVMRGTEPHHDFARRFIEQHSPAEWRAMVGHMEDIS